MSEQDKPSKKTAETLKSLTAAASLAAVLFSASGFIAVRTYINSLGLPADATVSVQGYLQYGGRFFFVFFIHLFLIGSILYLVFLLLYTLSRKWRLIGFVTENTNFYSLCVTFSASLTIYFEIGLLHGPSIIQTLPADPASGAPLAAPSSAGIALWMVEAAVVAISAAIFHSVRKQSKLSGNVLTSNPFLPLAVLSTLIMLLLLPACFGRTVIPPKRFDSVSMSVKNQAPRSGWLIFAGDNSYFLYTENRKLLQIRKDHVSQILYELDGKNDAAPGN